MSGFLDNGQIEKLFTHAREGAAPLETADRKGRRARWLRTVDFSRPTKFSTDQERRIKRALDLFAERAPTRLAAEHRTAMEFEVIDVGQFTFADAFALVPDGCLYVGLDTAPHPGRMLLAAELSIVLVAFERMLGRREPQPRERELTDIDLMVLERLFTTIVAEMAQIWFDIAEMTFSVASVDTQADTVQVALSSEPTLAVTLEVRIEGVSATMTLLVPHQAIAPIAHAFSRLDDKVTEQDPSTVAAVKHGLSLVDVTLRAEVGDTTMSIADVLALRPGDVVRLDAEASADVALLADETLVHRGRPGRSGKWRAVQISGPAEASL